MAEQDSQAIPDVLLENVAGLPEPLAGDPRRQAVPSIHGIVYQAWWSIDAWLRLVDADEVIYLEGAEDFDVVRSGSAVTVQVKRTADTISLGTKKALIALENFWTLTCSDPHRRIDFRYLTTGSISKERDADFGAENGITAWRVAQTNPELATRIARYLEGQLAPTSSLREFLHSASPSDLQESLFRRFHWFTNQPDVEALKRSVNDRITVLLHEQKCSLSYIENVSKYLESTFWDIVVNPSPARRCLTRGELLRQVNAATTIHLAVPHEQLPDLLAGAHSGFGLLALLREKSPRPPSPLLRRPSLEHQVAEAVEHRKAVLLTGTVHQGKTTVAQLVASTLCPNAWWITLSGRQDYQVDNLMLALARSIESGDCPALVIIDDLDVGPAALNVYRDSLQLVICRANATGRGVVLTAQGSSDDTAVAQHFTGVELIAVPALRSDEIRGLCLEQGCPDELANSWAPLLSVLTSGHPKLVQVQLIDLSERRWPKPSPDAFIQPPAVTSAKQTARQLLSSTVQGPVAEFIYLASESSVLLRRTTAVRLADTVVGLPPAGDVIDNLTGKWLERVEGGLLRVTALIRGTAIDVWSAEKRARAHVLIHDAILAERTLEPSEAAALLFHAYIGGDTRQLAATALRLQQIQGADAKREVDRQLLWLPYVALEPNSTITQDPFSNTILRGLQFRVASTLDAEPLPAICARWDEDINRIVKSEAADVSKVIMWLSVGFSFSSKVPIEYRLKAISGLPTLRTEIQPTESEIAGQFFANAEEGLPAGGTVSQAILLVATRSIRNIATLTSLIEWLDNSATDEMRSEFDAMLEWPLVQTLGAYVQGAWAAAHQETSDWDPWLSLFDRTDEYAKRRASPRLGREAAKAKAIILTEYLERAEDALRVLDSAEAAFGPSHVLTEQRANTLFQTIDDVRVLELWGELTRNRELSFTLDPFAYRRAGVSASRLERWEDAERIFLDGAESIRENSVTKFGLRLDSALATSLGGNPNSAAKLLATSILALPPEAKRESDDRWEAVQRAAVAVSGAIENSVWKPGAVSPSILPGYASSPDLRVPRVEPGQAVRSEIMQARALHLVSTLLPDPAMFAMDIEALAHSKYPFVRWLASEALLSASFSKGAGVDFIHALLSFDKALSASLARVQNGVSVFEPNNGADDHLVVAPERWIGMLYAGLICSGANLTAHLHSWHEASRASLGPEAALTNTIEQLIEGSSLGTDALRNAAADLRYPAPIRCGAAAVLLQNGLPASDTLAFQGLLTSACVSDNSVARQPLFNRHVARQFSLSWRTHAKNTFQFYSPRTSIPNLLHAIDAIDRGRSTLKTVLMAASSALHYPLGEFMNRVH